MKYFSSASRIIVDPSADLFLLSEHLCSSAPQTNAGPPELVIRATPHRFNVLFFCIRASFTRDRLPGSLASSVIELLIVVLLLFFFFFFLLLFPLPPFLFFVLLL